MHFPRNIEAYSDSSLAKAVFLLFQTLNPTGQLVIGEKDVEYDLKADTEEYLYMAREVLKDDGKISKITRETEVQKNKTAKHIMLGSALGRIELVLTGFKHEKIDPKFWKGLPKEWFGNYREEKQRLLYHLLGKTVPKNSENQPLKNTFLELISEACHKIYTYQIGEEDVEKTVFARRVNLKNFLLSKEELWNATATRKTIKEKDKSGRLVDKKVAFFSQSPKEAMLLRAYEKNFVMDLYGKPWRAKTDVDVRYDHLVGASPW